jgi:hypothetical protein
VLKTFDIDDVEEGMFVDSIAEQQGEFKITSPGRITSLATVKQLKKKGILSVVVDMSKQLKPELVDQKQPEIPVGPFEKVSFDKELEVAIKLHTKGKRFKK